MLTSFLTLLGSTTFIISAIVGIFILMAILLEFEKEGWATTFFSLGIALVLWNFKSDIWQFISSSPWSTLMFALTYVLVGIGWSFLKWFAYVKTIFNKFKELREEFIASNKAITSENRKHFNQLVEDAGFKNANGERIYTIKSDESLEQIAHRITPRAAKKKSVITAWISYWPVSMVGTLFNNPFRQFFEWVYRGLSGYYDKMAKRYQKDAFGF